METRERCLWEGIEQTRGTAFGGQNNGLNRKVPHQAALI